MAKTLLARALSHVASVRGARRHFPDSALDAIQKAIADGEARHRGQVCFAVEGSLTLSELVRRTSSRQRATELFAHLRVWDTEHNCGVLIYVLLADRVIEIVADRGIAARVPSEQWSGICTEMRHRFLQGEYQGGAVAGVKAVSDLLALHFPADGERAPNELPDRPIRL